MSGAIPHLPPTLMSLGHTQGQLYLALIPVIASIPFGCNVIHGEAILDNPATDITCKIRFVTVPIVAGSGWRGGGVG